MKTLLKISLVNILVIIIAYLCQGLARPDVIMEQVSEFSYYPILGWSAGALFIGFLASDIILPFTPRIHTFPKKIQQGLIAIAFFAILASTGSLVHTFYYQRSDLIFENNDVQALMDNYGYDKYDFYHITNFQLSEKVGYSVKASYTSRSNNRKKYHSAVLFLVAPLLDTDNNPVRLWYTPMMTLDKEDERSMDLDKAISFKQQALERQPEWFRPVNPDIGVYQQFAAAARQIEHFVKGTEYNRRFLMPIYYNPLEWRDQMLLFASIAVAVMNLFLFIIMR